MRLPAVGGRGGLNCGFTFDEDGAPDGAVVVVVDVAASTSLGVGTDASIGCGAGRFPDVGGGVVGTGSLVDAVGAGRFPDVGGDGVHAVLAR
jgi:hypothetical protein